MNNTILAIDLGKYKCVALPVRHGEEAPRPTFSGRRKGRSGPDVGTRLGLDLVRLFGAAQFC